MKRIAPRKPKGISIMQYANFSAPCHFVLRQVFWILCLVTGSATWAQPTSAPPPAVIYNYHESPPFITAPGKGLSMDLADYLTTRVGGMLTTQSIPRKRLDREMASPEFNGVVLLVNPLWFGDDKMKNHLWTDPIFVDEDVIVSPAGQRIDYRAPESLKGKTIGIVRGYQYSMFDALIAAGQLTRFDTDDETSGLKMLSKSRVDSIVIARSALGFLAGELNVNDKIYVSKFPVERYERRLLVSRKNPQLKRRLDDIVAAMPKDPGWIQILKKYNMSASK